MNKIAVTTIILCFISILSVTSPQVCQAETQIKIHNIFNFWSLLDSPLVIIDNADQYKKFVKNSLVSVTSATYEKYGGDDSLWEHPQIDFANQILILLNAPSYEAPKVNRINYVKNTLIIEAEYSEKVYHLNGGGFKGTAILIDRPDTTIKLSENSLRQHEIIYGKKLQCYRNSTNKTVEKEIIDACRKSTIKIYNDIYRLKRKFSELKKFNKNNKWIDPETNKITGVSYRSDSGDLYSPLLPECGLKLSIHIGPPNYDHLEPGIMMPSIAWPTFEKQYINICAEVYVKILTDNKDLKNRLLTIIKKRIAPLEKLNNVSN